MTSIDPMRRVWIGTVFVIIATVLIGVVLTVVAKALA